MIKKTTLIVLAVLMLASLIGIYIGRLIFTDWYIGVFTNDQIVSVGNYIDTNVWAHALFFIFTNYIILLLFSMAACSKLKFKWWQYLILLGYCIGHWCLAHFFVCNPVIHTFHFYLSVWLAPFIFNPKTPFWKPLVVYGSILFISALVLEIRDIPLYTLSNSVSTFLITSFDVLIWMALMCTLFNIKGGKKYGTT